MHDFIHNVHTCTYIHLFNMLVFRCHNFHDVSVKIWSPIFNAPFCFFLSGVFIARGKEDALVTRNMVVGESVYGEKRISVEVS